MTIDEKVAFFLPRVREVLERLEDGSVVAILGAAAHRRFTSGPPQKPAAGPIDDPSKDGPPEERNPLLEQLAYDAETQLLNQAAHLPDDERRAYFRAIEDAATDILRGRGYEISLVPHH